MLSWRLKWRLRAAIHLRARREALEERGGRLQILAAVSAQPLREGVYEARRREDINRTHLLRDACIGGDRKRAEAIGSIRSTQEARNRHIRTNRKASSGSRGRLGAVGGTRWSRRAPLR